MPSLYVHVPFCLKKCDYCAFYSVPLLDTDTHEHQRECREESSERVSRYLQGIAAEIQLRKAEAPQGVSSLFLGGGTPTVLAPKALDQLLQNIHAGFAFETNSTRVEKTVEANPGTLKPEKLAVLRQYGINRISLGVQSFNDELLKGIGRIHTAEDIYHAVKFIRNAQIDNLNLDLIFGLPGQTMADWQKTLQKAVELSPEHLSIYALTLEEKYAAGQQISGKSESDGLGLSSLFW